MPGPMPRGRDPRRVAYDVLRRIDDEGAYANLVLPATLARSGLDERDRALVTELVYGTTRMRRACDHLLDRFLVRDPEPALRTLLRLGAYQLAFARIPAHAAVATTVALAPPRWRGVANAVLRKVATAPVTFPDDATRLSQPDWIVERLRRELGEDADAALARMNEAPLVSVRADGYVQDRSSQEVAAAVGARAGERVADLCAAPGGKATALAATGAEVVAVDLQPHRARLVVGNARRLGTRLPVVVGDATVPPLRDGVFDRVLLDAPCSGLGALRRRPDARWHVTADDVTALAALQGRMLVAARRLVRPGGVLVYSVCTLTAAESIDHDDGTWDALEPLPPPWRAYGRGARLLPQDLDSDGMVVLRWRRPG
jgi:16S rRNA (cytosine967-C5)-methyltransferase